MRVAATGRRWVTPSFIVQYQPPRQDSIGHSAPAIGFTVTKKVGNAVVRNRLRRRMKEVARLLLADKGVMGATYVMVGREAGVDAPFDKLVKDMKWALEKLAANADLQGNPRPKGPQAPRGKKNPAKMPKKVHE